MSRILALDMATSHISFTAINGEKQVSTVLYGAASQSETLVPAVDELLNKVGLQPKELECTALTSGPGSFTGLRLAFSLLKGLELAHRIPAYGVPTLEAYAYPFAQWPGAVVPLIDAKKNRFYVSVFRNGTQVCGPLDCTCEHLLAHIDEEESLLLVGNEAPLFYEQLSALRPLQDVRFFALAQLPVSASVAALALQYRQNGVKPLAEYEGPFYLRKSEAEENTPKT